MYYPDFVGLIAGTLRVMLRLYGFVLLFRALMSWFTIDPYHPIPQMINRLTEPVLAPIRRVLPPVAMMDFSIVVAMVGIVALEGLLTILERAL